MVNQPRDMFDAIRRLTHDVRKLGLGVDSVHVHPDDNPDGHTIIWGHLVTPDSTIKRGYVWVKVSGVMAADWTQAELLDDKRTI